jgi:DNA-binding PadR family transcriptional regulator
MAHSDRERHRDRDAGRRHLDGDDSPAPNRVFRLTDDQRQQIAQLLRHIDEARRALEHQQNPDNREIIRDLRASADQIYDLLNDLEETDA